MQLYTTQVLEGSLTNSMEIIYLPVFQSVVVEEVQVEAERLPLQPDPLEDQSDCLHTPLASRHIPPGNVKGKALVHT